MEFREQLFQEFTSILEEEGIPHDQLSDATRLKDLELSSMQFLRVVGALEDLVGLPLDAGISQVDTVGDLLGELSKLRLAV